MLSFIADFVIIIAGAIYIADNWQQLKNLLTTNKPGS